MINALKPFVQAMNAALSGIIDFAEKVVNALGKIFGWVIEITPSDMAIDDAMIDVLDDQTSGLEDVADAADDAAKSIEKAKEEEEEYQRTVLGFDELNKLNAEKEKKEEEPGASNKGNSAVGNPLKNLDLSKASAGAGDVKMSVKKIKSLYESEIDTLYDLGKYISETLTKALNGIQWDKVYEGARGFGKGLASFLNGLITPDLFSALGRTIANSLNTALNFLNSFGKEFDFKNFGNALKAGLDALLANFNWDLAKDTARTWAKGMADGLNEFINPETFAALGRTIAEGINTALDFLDEFSRDFDFKNLGDSIENGLIALLGTIDWKTAYSAADGFGTGLADFLNELITPNLFDEVGKTVASVMNTALHFLDSFGETFKWEKFGTSLATGVNTFLDTFDWKLLGTSINTWVNGVFDAIKEFLATIEWDKLFDGVKTTLSQISFASIGTNIIDTLWAGISGGTMPEETRQKVLTSLSGLETTLRNISGFVFTGLETLYNNVLKPLGEWVLSDGVTSLSNIISNQFKNVDWDSLASGLEAFATAVGKFTRGVFDGFVSFFEDISEFPLIGLLLNTIGSGLNALFGSLDDRDYTQIENMGNALGTVLAAFTGVKIASSLAGTLTNVAGALPGLFTALAGSSVGGPLLVMAGAGGLVFGLDKLTEWFNENNDMYKSIKNTADEIDNLAKTLADGKIGEDTDYEKIATIFDDFWELNTKLANGGELTAAEEGMFQEYLRIIGIYAPDIKKEIDVVTGAYKGTREELEKLIQKQKEQAENKAILDWIDEMNNRYVEQKIQLNDVVQQMRDKLRPQLEEIAKNRDLSIKLNREDLDSFIEFAANAREDTGLLTENMRQFFETATPQAFDTVLQSSDPLWEQYDEGKRSVDKAKESLDLVYDMLEQNASKAEETGGRTAQALVSLGDDYGKAQKIITEKATGMYTDVNAKMDDISKSLEDHGVDGGLKIGAFPWESPMADVMGKIETAVSTGKQNVGTEFDNMSDDITTKLGDTATNANTKADDLVNEYSKGIKDNQGKIDKAVDDVTSSTDNKLSKNAKDANTRGQEVGTEFTEGIKSKEDMAAKEADYLASHAINYMSPRTGSGGGGTATLTQRSLKTFTSDWKLVVEEDCLDTIRKAYGIVSGGPSSVMDAIGNSAIGGLIKGVADKVPEIKSEFESLPGKLKDKMGNVFNFFKPSGEDTIGGLKQGEEDKRTDFLDLFPVLIDDARKKFDNVKHIFELLGKVIPISLKQGVYDNQSTLLTYIGNIYTSITGAFVNLSADMYSIGANAIASFKNGWTSVHIPVPHINTWATFTTVGDKLVSIPNFGVNWYAKGGLAYGASVIGVGEAGNEAVIPLENPGVMQAIAEAIVTAMPDAVTRGMVAANVGNDNRPIVVNATLRTENNEVLARAVAQGQRQIDYRQNAVARY